MITFEYKTIRKIIDLVECLSSWIQLLFMVFSLIFIQLRASMAHNLSGM